MDSNNKNNFRLNPLPPSYLSGLVMYCPSVQANSVHACNAGNVNDRLNRWLESRAGLVVWLAAIPYWLTNVARRMGVPRACDLLITIVHTYSQNKLLYSFRETCLEYCRRRKGATCIMLQAMATDAKHHALPLRTVIDSLRRVNGYSNVLCDSQCLWFFPLLLLILSTLLHHPHP